MKTNGFGIEVGLQLFNFVIPLHVTYISSPEVIAEGYQDVC